MSKSEFLRRILDDIEELPPLPEIAARVMEMTNDPDASASELNKVISQDEALTANLLKLCNSSYYGLPRVISSVTQAIMYLGFQTVRNMVLSSTIDKILREYDLSMYGYGRNGLAEHSFSTAVASQVISKKLRPGLRDTAFTAGLLHDVGKIILGKYIGEHENELREVLENGPITREVEQEFFGTDHAEVGAKVADQWNFPHELILAIGHHHNPEEADGRPLLAVIVYLANIACLRLGNGLSQGPVEEPVSDYCTEATGTSENDLPALCEEVRAGIEAMATPQPTGNT